MREIIDMNDPFSSTNSKSKPMITIRDAYKSYGKNNAILKGLCMTVQHGTIYGLLGPSGCGKTTLLCCITGQTELDQGSVELNIKRRTQLGYMPQSISLFDELSVIENFMVYGYLMGMSKDEIKVQSRNLISFLEIPSANRIVRDMSGGQQRRVSMAVTFLSDPTVLILDEPTVGLDPILCQSIWEKLLELADKGKSIVITTHYIQEAQRAHKVGLMRNGQLLVEDNPLTLIDKFECTNLEEVFYRAITEQKSNTSIIQSNQSNIHNLVDRVHNYRSVKVRYEDDDEIASKTRVKGVFYKTLVKLRRDYILFWFTMSFPMLQCLLFSVAVGNKPQNLQIAIINEEIPLDDCHLYDLNRICLFDNKGEKYFSCRFVDEIKRNNFEVLEYNDVNDALDDLRDNKVRGIVRLPSNYTTSLSELFTQGLKTNDSDDIIRGFPDFWMDNSNFLILNFLKYDLLRALVEFLRQIALNCGLNPDTMLRSIKIEQPIRGDVEGKRSGYMAVAMVVLSSFYFPAFSTAVMFIAEKVGGQVERMLVAGVTPVEMIIAQVCIQLSTTLLQIVIMLVITHVVFDNPLEGNGLTMFWLMVITSVSGIMYGFILALITNNMAATLNVGMATSFVLSVTCGIFGPRESMDDIIKYMSEVLPITWGVEAARSIADKSASFTDKSVFKGFYTTAIWNLLFFLLLFYYVRYKRSSFVAKS